MSDDQLKQWAHSMPLSDGQIDKIKRFVELFLIKNQELNLAKVDSEEEFWIKHIVDSIQFAQFLKLEDGMNVADLGSGGGFPGIILAILFPKIQFTLIDSVQKKMAAVQGFANDLKLANLRAVSGRLEVLGQSSEYREQFDWVTARALAPLPVLLEYAIPFVKRNGFFAAMKGPGYLEEINDADQAMELLKLDYPRAERYELPNELGRRFVLVFEKKKTTSSKYPRRDGVPKKKPL